MSDFNARFHVLNKLFRKRCWGGSHKMNEDILAKGAPKSEKNRILSEADQLLRQGWLCLEGGGLHGKRFFLNRRMFREICEYIEKYRDKF